jgi:glutathione S-transferase
MKVYGDIASGNCYKIKLIASILDIEHEWIHVDILGGATGTAEFLEKNPNLVGEQLTVADISLYAYTHVANEGGFDLSEYPAIQRRLNEIAAHPNYVSMV